VIHKKKTVGKKPAGKNFKLNLMTIRKWHWMSSALCFVCMLLFSVTGITLNHAGSIEASPTTTQLEGVVPDAVRAAIILPKEQKNMEIPAAVLQWSSDTHKLNFTRTQAEINDAELYLA